MKKSCIYALLLLPLFCACGGGTKVAAGNVADVARTADGRVADDIVGSGVLESFSAVELEAPVELYYTTASGQARYEMRGSAALAGRIQIDVKDGRLTVRMKRGRGALPRSGNLRIDVTGPALSAVKLSGTGDLTADAVTAPGDAGMRLDGTGSLRVGAVRAGGALRAVLAGTGDLSMGRADVEGRAELCLSGTGNLGTGALQAGGGSLWQLSGTGSVRAERIAGGDCSMELLGTGDMYVAALTVPGVSMCLSGTGNLAADGIDAGRLDVRQTGMGGLRLKGRTDDLRMKAEGQGNVEAVGLTAERAEVSAGGFCMVDCHVTQALTVDVAEHARVRYKGQPVVTDHSERRREYLQHID